ncbi:AAA family ATPase [Candidatus Clostridium stratigraminis]|uniref:CpaE family protein n=1 Tax=Candidatus Clostridium stratigraminis TaxID=3381661 RepID=A0ABW8T7T6_9CLOT
MKEEIDKKLGKMAVFVSSKGGVGKTVVSVNVAATLASKGFSTCIVDGSFQFGDVNLALDIQPRYTISDLAQKDELENIRISDYLYNHDSGLKVLSAPLKPELADLITPDMIPVICDKLREDNEFFIADLTTGISEINLNFIEKADLVFIVTDLELSALRNTKTMLRTFEKLNMESKLRVIVNRSDTETLTKASQVPDILETNDIIYVMNNFKVVTKSLNIGIPFVISKPNEKITSDIISITREFNMENSQNRRRRKRKGGLMGILAR